MAKRTRRGVARPRSAAVLLSQVPIAAPPGLLIELEDDAFTELPQGCFAGASRRREPESPG